MLTRDNIPSTIATRPVLSFLLILSGLLLICILLFWENFLVSLGNVLVVDEQPSQAEYIVVLQGGTPDRIVHGAELYQQGYADNILMAESRSFTNYDLIDKHNLDLPTGVEINKQAAIQIDVDQEDITIVPGKVDSTSQEAKKISQYLKESYNNFNDKSIILVTSKFHSHRAKYIFREALTKNDLQKVEIISSPSPYDPYSPEKWWTDRRQSRHTFMEYLKFINTLTFGF